jgi:peroxiredoxin
VSFARKYDEFQKRGAEITAICVDSPDQNRAMIDKLLLPFKILSDPEGDLAIERYDVWNEQGRIAIPAVVVVGHDQRIRYRYAGQDFADRPGDDDIFRALEAGGTDGAR